MLQPNATIGILGGGQLARMLSVAAIRMGYRVVVYNPEEDCPAKQVGAEILVAAYTNDAAIERFVSQCDVITFEFENIPDATLEKLKQSDKIFPSSDILRTSRHRAREKTFIEAQGLKPAPYRAVTSLDELTVAAVEIGYPCVLKTCELGYDGKGQVKIKIEDELPSAWETLQTTDAVLEGWLNYQCEISVIVAADKEGRISCYEPSHNLHENHVLSRCKVPANITPELVAEAKRQAVKLAEALKLVGVMAVEMFVMPNGEIRINELAPRPHNSGHWTIEAAATSQFEQLIRAITGQRLGSVQTLHPVEMLNLIGDDVNDVAHYMHNPQAHLHLYGKREARPGRKMGHVTFLKD